MAIDRYTKMSKLLDRIKKAEQARNAIEARIIRMREQAERLDAEIVNRREREAPKGWTSVIA